MRALLCDTTATLGDAGRSCANFEVVWYIIELILPRGILAKLVSKPPPNRAYDMHTQIHTNECLYVQYRSDARYNKHAL